LRPAMLKALAAVPRLGEFGCVTCRKPSCPGSCEGYKLPISW
jgi:hypothetical protein